MIARLRRLWNSLGSLPAQHVTWGLVVVFSAWVLLDVFVLRVTGGVAQSTYDTMLRARFWAAAPDPRIVIDTGGLLPEATELANRLSADIGKLKRDDLVFLRHELMRRAGKA